MLAGIVALAPATATSASPGQHYTWTPINMPGESYTNPVGINDLGVVAGTYAVPAPAYNDGFIERGGHFTTIDDLAGVYGTIVTFDNDLGVIGGFYYDTNGIVHGFTDIYGRFTTITDPSAGATPYSDQGTFPEVQLCKE